MKLEFYDYDALDRDTIDGLWAEEVNMDDWDYVLFVPICHIGEFYEINTGDDHYTYEPESENLCRLLTGTSDNVWYKVNDFRGRKGIIGVAYHA